MKSEIATGLIAFGLGVVLMPRFTILASVLLVFGGLRLLKCFGRKRHQRDTYKTNDRCRVPREAAIRRKVQKLNRLYNRSKGRYPELASDYEAIIQSLWQELSELSNEKEWHETLDQVLREWPTPFDDSDSPLSESLARARIATDAWRRAHRTSNHGTVI